MKKNMLMKNEELGVDYLLILVVAIYVGAMIAGVLGIFSV